MTDQPTAPDPYEAAAEEAIAACGGDMRAALKAALIAMTLLEAEVMELTQATSRGYARRKLSNKGAA